VAEKIRNVHAQTLLGETSAEVLHDDVVRGDAVKEDDRSEFGGGGKILAFDGQDLHAAGGGVNDVAFFGVAPAGHEHERATDEKTKNAGESFVDLRNRFQRTRSPGIAQVRA